MSDFQPGIGVAAHATVDMEQLISCTRTGVVDTIVSLQGSDGGVVPVQEVVELLTAILDILDNDVSEKDGNTGNILAILFMSASRQDCEVRAS